MSKKNFQIILFYFFVFISSTVFFIFLFHTPIFNNISVFFYRGIIFLILTTLLTAILLFYFKNTFHNSFITVRDIILLMIIIFCLNLVAFTLAPVTADRSISVFLLGYMNNDYQKLLTDKEITSALITKYIYRNGAIDKRLEEQIVSGNIIKKGEKYEISGQGKLLMIFYNIISDLFKINKKNI